MAETSDKVYAVVLGEDVHGVFSSYDRAERYADSLPEMAPGQGTGAEIDEFVLDAKAPLTLR